MKKTLQHCCHPPVAKRAIGVAIVVGTILNLINHYGVLLRESISTGVAVQMALTYLVPYFVSVHGQTMNSAEK